MREPTADSRPKVRTRADQKNIEALAAAGFGSAEIGIDFRGDPTSERAALRALLQTSRRVGLHLDLAPGGGQPYASPGIELKDSMQQLVSEAATVSGPMQHLHVDEQLPECARTHELDLNELMDWRQIPELKDAVGSALYAAEVSLPPEWFGADRGILLSVGAVHGAMQLMVNDHLVTEQTTGHGQWLVGPWLKPGVNSLKVRLDTTLLNRMVALRASGDGRYQTGPTALTSAPSGLLGPVILSSVARVTAPF